MRKRILFVDDEESLLRSLRRSLRPLRGEWEMEFAPSARRGLEILERSPCDVVVSDMRMPGMDGAAFFDEVMKRYPETIRIILSGQTQADALLRSVGAAHQFISKPCDAGTLTAVISRAARLRDLLEDPKLKRLLSRLKTLPALPSNYLRITEELSSKEPSIRKVGEIVARDIGMTAKILQVVNSVVCGTRVQVTDPVQATVYIGVEMVKALVLLSGVFSQFERKQVERVFVDTLWDHSVMVGQLSRKIAEAEGLDRKLAESAFTAGLLHDIGKLALAASLPVAHAEAREAALQESISTWEAERRTHGATHADVGAYLVGIWGLPEVMFQAILRHHDPEPPHEGAVDVVVAVSAANFIANARARMGADTGGGPPAGDDLPDWLCRFGLEERLVEWWGLAAARDRS